MQIKEQFPDETSLKTAIKQQLPSLLERVQSGVGHLEQKYKRAKRSSIYGLALIVIGMILFIFVDNIQAALWLKGSMVIIGVALVLSGFYMLVKAQEVITEFNRTLNKLLFPLVLRLFNLSGSHSDDNERGEKLRSQTDFKKLGFKLTLKNIGKLKDPILKELDDSQLITEARNTVHTEDSMSININNKSLFVQELDVKHVTRRGKRSHTKNIFKGYFASFELQKPLEHITFVSTEGDENGFGHQSFWSATQANKLETTELEWNDFEEKLHVKTTSPTEARYILTPSFMQDLYDWWKEKHEHIRVSFLDNKMYLLFPSKQIRIGQTIPKISEEEVQEYIESIALPLLHVLHLVEDVEDGF